MKRHTSILVPFLIASAMLCGARANANFPGNVMPSQNLNQDALAFFAGRAIWKDLPRGVLTGLATALKSLDTTRGFALLCESSGILQNNILAIREDADQDPSFAIGAVAATLTSYANSLAGEGRFSEAIRPLEFAMLLKDRHVPAWVSRALVAINMSDCTVAVAWADRVLSFAPDPDSDDPWEQGIARMSTAEGGRQAAQALGEPGIAEA